MRLKGFVCSLERKKNDRILQKDWKGRKDESLHAYISLSRVFYLCVCECVWFIVYVSGSSIQRSILENMHAWYRTASADCTLLWPQNSVLSDIDTLTTPLTQLSLSAFF